MVGRLEGRIAKTQKMARTEVERFTIMGVWNKW